MPHTFANRFRGGLIALLTVAVLSGCTQWRYDMGNPLSPSQTPEPGQAPTLTEVLAQLGPPMRLSATADGYVLAWEHWRVAEDTIGLSLGPFGADFLSIDWGAARMQGEFILATFDFQHRLTSAAFSTWDSDAGSGAALQPFVGMSLVDVGDLVGRMPHHHWGAANLERLPEAINNSHRPDTGQAGIQQRGTPRGAGQRSLEMD